MTLRRVESIVLCHGISDLNRQKPKGTGVKVYWIETNLEFCPELRPENLVVWTFSSTQVSIDISVFYGKSRALARDSGGH